MSVDAHPQSSNIGLNCDAEGDRENWRIEEEEEEEEEEERRREKSPEKTTSPWLCFVPSTSEFSVHEASALPLDHGALPRSLKFNVFHLALRVGLPAVEGQV